MKSEHASGVGDCQGGVGRTPRVYSGRILENTLKQRLYAGKAAFGIMCTPRSWIAVPGACSFPHVNTADEARAAVDAVKYAPERQRGIFSEVRAASYRFKGATADNAGRQAYAE